VEEVIEFAGVSKTFQGLAVLRDVSFRVGEGQVVGIVGPSGSGKTTILRLTAGLLEPDAGRVSRRSGRLAYVFQEARLLPWRTALDNIALVLRAAGRDRRSARDEAHVWMERLGLQGFEHYYPAKLSGGMAQRVAIGRAFAARPDVLLMDEPFSGLDRALKNVLMPQLASLIHEEGTTAAYVTHDLPEALRLCDRILELEPGGSLRELDLTDRGALLLGWVSGIMTEWQER
jgi:NitT/TauT family transport system ATP-binding protein